MGIGVSVFLLAIGAILAFAVDLSRRAALAIELPAIADAPVFV